MLQEQGSRIVSPMTVTRSAVDVLLGWQKYSDKKYHIMWFLNLRAMLKLMIGPYTTQIGEDDET
jgi:hypothetical protein